MNKKTYTFQTEVTQLLQLMVHSLYSNKEIFLRELISNSSDALDKLRFQASMNDKLYDKDSELKILVGFDEKGKTLFVQDNGIGMNYDEVVENIGTIANSGTKKFLDNLTGNASKDNNLIGQFGVGFYSSFMVADKVDLYTKKAGENTNNVLHWQSNGDGKYSIDTLKDKGFSRGTKIVLHLKKDSHSLLSLWELKNLISKYSDNICFPIFMQEEEEIVEPEIKKDDKKNKADLKDKDNKTTKTKTKKQLVWKQTNKAKAIWVQNKSELKAEDYNEFYKTISHDYADPLAYMHNKVEGTLEYSSLLYIPKNAPFDLWDRNRKYGLKLYVKRVFIMDNAEDLLPSYLRFVKGIIDSDDLPLNISREILQSNKFIAKIKSATTNRILAHLEKLSKSKEEAKKQEFTDFYKAFGKVLKEGIIEDLNNKEKIAKILRFSHLHGSENQDYSLDEYIANFNKEQKDIYYITSENYQQASGSPHLEIFKDKKIDVLLLTDPVDEWLAEHLNEYNSKKLVSVTAADIEGITSHTDDKTKDSSKDSKEDKHSKENKDLLNKIKKSLAEKVSDVKISKRLTNSPSCIIDDGMTSQMSRIMSQMGQSMPQTKPALEINPKHQILKKIAKLKDEKEINEWSALILSQAQLAKSGHLENPSEFIELVNNLIKI